MPDETTRTHGPEPEPRAHAARVRSHGIGTGILVRPEVRKLRRTEATGRHESGRRHRGTVPVDEIGSASRIGGRIGAEHRRSDARVVRVHPVRRTVGLEDGVTRQDGSVERAVDSDTAPGARRVDAGERALLLGSAAVAAMDSPYAIPLRKQPHERIDILADHEQAAPPRAQIRVDSGQQALGEEALTPVDSRGGESRIAPPRHGEDTASGLRGGEQTRMVIQAKVAKKHESDGGVGASRHKRTYVVYIGHHSDLFPERKLRSRGLYVKRGEIIHSDRRARGRHRYADLMRKRYA